MEKIVLKDLSDITADAHYFAAGGTSVYRRNATLSNNATSWQGGGSTHNNMPPYLGVYMWKRTA